jgi:flagellar protein FlbT
MALKISLKPDERVVIGSAAIKNGSAKAEFTIENNVPILRQKDIMSLSEADSPCKRIYFTIQLMYIDGNDVVENNKIYWELVKDLAEAAPSTKPLLYRISEDILNNRHYQAMKLARELIDYEKEAIARGCKSD